MTTMEDVPLCAIDKTVPCYVPLAWVFTVQLSPARLRAALDNAMTVGGFYPLAGAVHADCVRVHGSPGVLWTVRDMTQELSVAEVLERGLARPLACLYEIPDADPVHAPPALAVRVTLLGGGGTAVAASLHHCLGDGTSFGRLMQRWFSNCGPDATLPRPLPTFSRAALPAEFRVAATGATASCVPAAVALEQRDTAEGAEVLVVEYDAASLARLKEKASPSGSDSRWVSTRDALLAHLWRCFVGCSNAHPEDQLRASIILNVRDRLSDVVPQEYFGNASIIAKIASPTRSELEAETLSSTALRVRDAIQKTNVLQSIAAMARGGVMDGFRPGVDITTSDQSGLGTSDVEFEGNRPAAVIPAPVRPWPGLIHFHKAANNGLVVLLHVTKVQAIRLKEGNALHKL